MSKVNTSTGSFEYIPLEIDPERDTGLVSARERVNAINGKFSNMDSQKRMITEHPDNYIKEDPNGQATGLSWEGKEFLRSHTAQEMEHLSRVRPDFVNKVGSDAVLRDLKLLVDQLKDSDNEADRNQANMIRIFAGYLKSKRSGKGIKNQDDYLKVYNAEINVDKKEQPSEVEEGT